VVECSLKVIFGCDLSGALLTLLSVRKLGLDDFLLESSDHS
jgi:hypothetical protein